MLATGIYTDVFNGRFGTKNNAELIMRLDDLILKLDSE